MKKIIVLGLCIVCVLAFNCYGSSEYDELNKEVCVFLDVPVYPVPKIEVVEKEKWVYSGIAIYVEAIDTIYILKGNLKDEVIIHELAHAAVSKYFYGKPVCQKIQEILAGFTTHCIVNKKAN